MKKAFLVTASLITRVIADENETDEKIIALAKDQLRHQFENDYNDIVEEVLKTSNVPVRKKNRIRSILSMKS